MITKLKSIGDIAQYNRRKKSIIDEVLREVCFIEEMKTTWS